MSGIIWIQPIWGFDCITERIFKKLNLKKKIWQEWKIPQHAKS